MTRGVATGPLRPWLSQEDELVLENYAPGKVATLAALLERTPVAVRARYRVLLGRRSRVNEVAANEASRPLDHGRRWTLEEHQFLEETMELPVAEVAAAVERSIFATQQRRHRILTGEEFSFDGATVYRPRQEPPVAPPTCSRCTSQHRGDC